LSKKRNDFLIWQYRNKPKAQQTVSAFFNETENTFSTVVNLAQILNIDAATGYALDLIGRHVGASRTLNQAVLKEYFGFLESDSSLGFGQGQFYRFGDSLAGNVALNDVDFRFFIRAKILKNYQTGNIKNIVDSVKYLIGNDSNVIDNRDMTMHIIINGKSLTEFLLYAITCLDILVRPVGVYYRFLVIENDTPFGFSCDEEAYGFNFGSFVRLRKFN